MGKYKYIKTVLLMITILFSACTETLEEVPLSLLSPVNLFQTVSDANAASIGMYAGLQADGTWKVQYPVYGWGVNGTDMCSNTNGNSIQSRFSNYLLTPSNDRLRRNWTALYSVINRANTIIDLVGGINASEKVINEFLGEAYLIRAFSYMDLVQFYGGVPLRLKPTESIAADIGIIRSSEAETWAQIISDLQFAEENLPPIATAGRATKWAAKGFLAKAYLTRGGYPVGNYQESIWFEKAAEKAFEVISESGKGLNPTTQGSPNAFAEYGKQFLASGENSPESLFEIQFLDGFGGSGWGFRAGGGRKWDIDGSSSGSYYQIGGGTIVGSDFALSFNDADVRFQWSIGAYKPKSKTNSTRIETPISRWYQYKYRYETIPSNAWETSVNAVVLRMADIYLILAEAANEATGSPSDVTYGMSAYDAINEVRQRAQVEDLDETYLMTNSPYAEATLLYGMSYASFDNTNVNYNGRHVYYTGAIKERFRAAVLQERAWELCFERHRWFDLKRTGNLIDFAKNTVVANNGKLDPTKLIDPVDKSAWLKASEIPKHSNKLWLPHSIQDYSIYVPIPEIEISLNPELSQDDQNPGY